MEFTEAWDDTCSSTGHAARTCNVKELIRLIRAGYSVDVADNRGWRPLHEAAASDIDVKCLEELLKHEKTDVNWQTHEGESALLLACKRRHGTSADTAVELLLKYGADCNIADNEEETPLLIATRGSLTNVVELLVTMGHADTNISDCSGWCPVHEAATTGHIGMLHSLLSAGAAIDVQDECGITPIFTAAQHGRVECLKLLLEVAKERGQQKFIDKGAEDWATPLMIAAQQGFTNCVKILLDYEANPNLYTQDNVTALHLAVQGDHVECLKLLLEKMDLRRLIQACQPSQLYHPGHPERVEFRVELEIVSPLHLAVEWHSHQCLQLLLEAGFPADSIYERTPLPQEQRLLVLALPRYETALSFAVLKEDIEAMIILLKEGASCNAICEQIVHPLLPAIANPTTRELELLLQRGSNVNYSREVINSNECLLLALGNHEALFHILTSGADPMLCFKEGNEASTNLFLNCLFYLVERQSLILKALHMLLPFTDVTTKFRAVCHSAAARGRELFTTSYDNTAWEDLLWEVDNPRPLKILCRIKIHRHLHAHHGIDFKHIINTLSLPAPLIRFLLHNNSE